MLLLLLFGTALALAARLSEFILSPTLSHVILHQNDGILSHYLNNNCTTAVIA